jgi:hypothetical protein
LVAVADIQAAAEGQIMSSCLWNSNPTWEMFDTVQRTGTK